MHVTIILIQQTNTELHPNHITSLQRNSIIEHHTFTIVYRG